MSKQIDCTVYRSPKKAELYLYLLEKDHFAVVPKPLLEQFGHPEFVMELTLDSERRLARADVNEVMTKLEQQGFFLQVPPSSAYLVTEFKAGVAPNPDHRD